MTAEDARPDDAAPPADAAIPRSQSFRRQQGSGVLADPDGLGVHELPHAEVGQLASVATAFDAAEGDLGVAGRVAVDEGHARLHVADKRFAFGLVLAPQVRPESA